MNIFFQTKKLMRLQPEIQGEVDLSKDKDTITTQIEHQMSSFQNLGVFRSQ